MNKWHTHEDGYNRELWLVDESGRVVGLVTGSTFTRKWYAFIDRPSGGERLGQYVSEQTAKYAVENNIRAMGEVKG